MSDAQEETRNYHSRSEPEQCQNTDNTSCGVPRIPGKMTLHEAVPA